MKLEIEIGTEEFQDQIVARAAEVLLDTQTDEYGERYRTRLEHQLRGEIDNIRREAIRAEVIPIVREALSGPIRRTNTFGEPTGPEITLRELVIAEAQRLMTDVDRHSSGTKRGETLLQKTVREEIEVAFTKELKSVIAERRAEVLDAVRARAAEVLTETIERASKGL